MVNITRFFILAHGVMVAQRSLTPLVGVRIPVGQQEFGLECIYVLEPTARAFARSGVVKRKHCFCFKNGNTHLEL